MTKMRFIDLHCDTVVCEVMGNEDSKNLRSNPTGMLDLLRMKEAGCLLQCFALYIPPMKRIASTTGEADEWDFFNDAADCYDRQMAANTDLIRPVGKYADIEKNMADGIMSSMMTIENGEPLNGKIERLDEMFRRGVRLITLTHNQENTLGYPNCLEPDAGLKPLRYRDRKAHERAWHYNRHRASQRRRLLGCCKAFLKALRRLPFQRKGALPRYAQPYGRYAARRCG